MVTGEIYLKSRPIHRLMNNRASENRDADAGGRK